MGAVESAPSRGGQGGAQKRRKLSPVSQTVIRLCVTHIHWGIRSAVGGRH